MADCLHLVRPFRAWTGKSRISLMYGNGGAIQVLKQAFARDHNNYESSYSLGPSYVTLGKHEMAVPLLERATKLDPEKSDPYYLLYRSYRALKQSEKATAALEQFKRLKSLGS